MTKMNNWEEIDWCSFQQKHSLHSRGIAKSSSVRQAGLQITHHMHTEKVIGYLKCPTD